MTPYAVPATAQTAIKTSAAPKGFEALSEPQTTLVDVYYAGRSLVSTLATFSSDTITIASPLEVASNIPKAKNVAEIVKSLTGELNSNTSLVCPEITEKVSAEVRKAILGECGRLSPKVAGVIFDESKFRLDIYVHPDFLDVNDLGLIRFLPASDSDASLLTNFTGALSGDDDTKNVYSLRNQTIIGLGEGRIRLNSDYSSTSRWLLDTATGELDREDQRYVGGIMRTRAMDTVGEFKMLGARYTTTTDTRIDLDVGFGSQLVVFLPRDAQVDILRDGRLISTKFYQAGKTTLDTSLMPDGAYDVVLRIKEAGGVTREETRFYVKTVTLPPADAPLFFLESGFLLSEKSAPYPELDHVGVIHGGTFWRLSENFGAGGDILAGENIVVGEARGLYLGRDLNLNLAGVVSSELDLGLTFGATGEIWDVTYSASVRRNWSQNKSSTAALFDPMSRSFTQARANLNYQWGKAQWSMQGQSQTNDDASDTWSFGPAVTYPLYRDAAWGAVLRAEATRSQSESIATARVQVRFNEPRWSASASAAVTTNNSDTAAANLNEGNSGDGSANVAWHDLDQVPGDLTVGAGVSAVKRTRTASSRIDYISRWGKYNFDVENNWGGATRSTRWGGNILTSVLTDGDIVAVGGSDRQDSGVVVSLDGIESEAEFNVVVNGSDKGTMRVGDRMPLLLTPYKTYSIRLEAAGGEFLSFNAENRDITLYPGNIVGVAWSINRIVAVFGRIVREDGTPVSFAKVDGAGKGTFTDDLGYFQTEMNKPGVFIVRPTEGQACEIVVKSLPGKADFADLKDITCTELLLEAQTTPGDKPQEGQVADADQAGATAEPDWTPVIKAYKRSLGGAKTAKSDKQATPSKVAKKAPEKKPIQTASLASAPQLEQQQAVATEEVASLETSPVLTTKPANLLAPAAQVKPVSNHAPPAYRVQLAALRSPDRLQSAWAEISARASGKLRNNVAYMARADLGDRGTFYRLQTGDAPDQKTAIGFCDDLAGEGLSCRVVKAGREVSNLADDGQSLCTFHGTSEFAPACPASLINTASSATPKAGVSSGASSGISGPVRIAQASQKKLKIKRPLYRVQLGSHLTAKDAIDDWQRIEKLSEGFLTGLEPQVAEANLKRRGVWYRLHVRVSEGRIAARNLCDSLADLSISCLVVRG